MRTSNVLKCKYCEYKVARWRGKGKYGGNMLWRHVVNTHDGDFLKAIGFNGTLGEYLDLIDEEEMERDTFTL